MKMVKKKEMTNKKKNQTMKVCQMGKLVMTVITLAMKAITQMKEVKILRMKLYVLVLKYVL